VGIVANVAPSVLALKLYGVSSLQAYARVTSPERIYIVTCISDYRREFGLVSRFIGYAVVVTTINDNTFKIAVIIANKIKPSISACTSRC
jgi:hypothetical protein